MSRSKYEHLTINCPLGPSETFTNKGIQNKYLVRLEKIVAHNQLLMASLRKLRNFYHECDDLRQEEIRIARSVELLAKEQPDAQKFGSAYGYDELLELRAAINYQHQLEQGVDTLVAESGKLYQHLEQKLSELASKGAKVFLNFGVGLAYVDSLVALKHPECHFVGIDRSEFTQVVNHRCYGHISNLECIAGDVFELLKTRRFDNGVLFTARTLLLLPRSFILKLYAAAAEAGIRQILAVEQIGISRYTGRPYEFSDEDKPSVPFRAKMFLHNYPSLLNVAGFPVKESQLIQTNHPHRDFRFLSVLGER